MKFATIFDRFILQFLELSQRGVFMSGQGSCQDTQSGGKTRRLTRLASARYMASINPNSSLMSAEQNKRSSYQSPCSTSEMQPLHLCKSCTKVRIMVAHLREVQTVVFTICCQNSGCIPISASAPGILYQELVSRAPSFLYKRASLLSESADGNQQHCVLLECVLSSMQ